MNKGFKILDAEGNAISIKALDKEVCDLVGVEVDPKYYCRLGKPEDFEKEIDYLFKTSNWYDTIGWMIASENKSFEDIIEYYTEPMKEYLGKTDENGTVITMDVIYPYHMKVLKTWIAKGYQPKSVEVY